VPDSLALRWRRDKWPCSGFASNIARQYAAERIGMQWLRATPHVVFWPRLTLQRTMCQNHIMFRRVSESLFRATVTYNLAPYRNKVRISFQLIFTLIMWGTVVVSLAQGEYGAALFLVVVAGVLTAFTVRHWRVLYRDRYPR
jgi:hypothetical protein